MSVIAKFKDLVGIEEEYDEDDFDVEEEEYGYGRKTVETRAPLTSQSRYGGSDNVVSMQNRTVKAITSTFKLMVIEPKGFDECSKLVDSLKSRKPIIVNLEKLDADTARKIFDFLGGATYALNGNVQKVANNIFVFAPENVSIFAEGENKPYSFTGENADDMNPWK